MRAAGAASSAGKVEREGEHLRITSIDGPQRARRDRSGRSTPSGLEPQSLTVREPSLDDVFLSLTGHRAEADDDATAVRRERRCRMSARTIADGDHRAARDRRDPARPVVRDTSAIAKRNLLGYLRVPQLLVFSTIQPVIFVLMFRYVFGGAIRSRPACRTSTS